MPELRDLLNLKPMVSHLPATPSARQQMTHTGPAPKSVELANGGGSLADYMKLLKGATIGSPEKLLTGNQEEIHTPFGDITYPSGAPDALAMLPFLGTAGEVAGDTMKGMKIASEPFFSALRRAIETKLPETFTGEQGMNVAKKFAKAEEIDWSKIGDFLKPGQRYNKADLMKHFDENAPVLHEQMIGGRPNVDSVRQRWIKDRERETSRMTRQELIEQALGDHPDEVAKSGDTEAIEVMNEYKKMNVAQLRNEVMDLHRQTAEELGYDELATDLKGVPKTDLPAKFSKWTLPGGANHRELVVTMPPKPADAAAREAHFNKWLEGYLDAHDDEIGSADPRQVFDNLPHGSQHSIRREYENNAFDDGDVRPGYTSPTGHSYGDPELDTNRLLHLRMNDRMTAEGEKALHVDELQSDWHQAGRQSGYKGPEPLPQDREKLIHQLNERLKENQYSPLDEEQLESLRGNNREQFDGTLEQFHRMGMDVSDIIPRVSKVDSVPDAPFKKTWHELGMKRALQEAAQGGYDRLTWTTGKQQADRYSLAKHFDVLRYNPASGELQGHDKQGWEVVKQYINGQKDLEDTVGQEMADKLLNNPTTKLPSIMPMQDEDGKWRVMGPRSLSPAKFDDIKAAAAFSLENYPAWHEVRGADLEIGGEGMKGFYDQMLPSYMKKVGKKYGVEPEMTDVMTDKKPKYSYFQEPGSTGRWTVANQDGVRKGFHASEEEASAHADALNRQFGNTQQVWSLKMTPEMRKDILGEGQPMYEGVPPIPPVVPKSSGQGTTATNQDDAGQNNQDDQDAQ